MKMLDKLHEGFMGKVLSLDTKVQYVLRHICSSTDGEIIAFVQPEYAEQFVTAWNRRPESRAAGVVVPREHVERLIVMLETDAQYGMENKYSDGSETENADLHSKTAAELKAMLAATPDASTRAGATASPPPAHPTTPCK